MSELELLTGPHYKHGRYYRVNLGERIQGCVWRSDLVRGWRARIEHLVGSDFEAAAGPFRSRKAAVDWCAKAVSW